ncbi:hypothetical protein SAMN05421688_1980 [Poseidonocella pacifica]|uniref:DNA gyrase inhibitor YacG n=1 Tax=Poseidonocella pacifica TaxID=871651 RepID=A0A1I0XB55_9RHOB|nr:DNA gyrase inhibitor YacG [Poseidonocella pacifica]SFA97153.1 hypothetical protein SAMN05421688_1980 [Poseidonocella pacifica]
MKCPICSRPAASEYRPFCSRRCADVDLGKWVSGAYSVPSQDPEDVERAIDEVEAQLNQPRH